MYRYCIFIQSYCRLFWSTVTMPYLISSITYYTFQNCIKTVQIPTWATSSTSHIMCIIMCMYIYIYIHITIVVYLTNLPTINHQVLTKQATRKARAMSPNEERGGMFAWCLLDIFIYTWWILLLLFIFFVLTQIYKKVVPIFMWGGGDGRKT